MPLPLPRVKVKIVCKDVSDHPTAEGMPSEIEVATFDGRIVNEMSPMEFPRSIIEDIEEAIVAAGCHSGLIGAKVTVSRSVDRGHGITVVRAKLRYGTNGHA
jgi:hypothetical protein